MELWELKHKQSLPLEAKVAMTLRRIREWYEYWDGNVYVSFSGGKDSSWTGNVTKAVIQPNWRYL